MRVLIIGCGYVGLPLGAELVRQGHDVFGLRRSDAALLKAAGITPLLADITQPGQLEMLPHDFDWVVNTVASGGGTVEDYRRTYLEGSRRLVDWLATHPPRTYVYTSSTSVYGQNDGSWVDETSPAEPPAETARVLVETEKLLLEAARKKNFPAVVLRVAGIYGPTRGYWLKQFQKGEARIEGEGARYLNMIHRDDVVGCLIAALKNGCRGEIYNAADNEPASQRDFFGWLATELGQSMPPSVPENLEARKRGATNKRVSNQKLRRELGYDFTFPTFREGYAGLL